MMILCDAICYIAIDLATLKACLCPESQRRFHVVPALRFRRIFINKDLSTVAEVF